MNAKNCVRDEYTTNQCLVLVQYLWMNALEYVNSLHGD